MSLTPAAPDELTGALHGVCECVCARLSVALDKVPVNYLNL